ncbi:hypothetical protein G7K_2085-t1 [Saitoella complicata NRRL Y-17804]|uniref:Uncharacterized protein n=1 Tax=Saitoella complicata (strain BCRC 22490 / CBS 7301 / JCM 7358 / NBRC 10748 / NRRL Y-17804) TaxID=698492 RepID=A0A0E9NDI2_SAICN|nr:hypothetical protein G7K_2085-t1 [Saitoella complicata NRRL Y-17804]
MNTPDRPSYLTLTLLTQARALSLSPSSHVIICAAAGVDPILFTQPRKISLERNQLFPSPQIPGPASWETYDELLLLRRYDVEPPDLHSQSNFSSILYPDQTSPRGKSSSGVRVTSTSARTFPCVKIRSYGATQIQMTSLARSRVGQVLELVRVEMRGRSS